MTQFRRINGRVIPIRDKKTYRESGKAGALAAGGLAISAAAGTVAARLTHESANAHNEAFKAAAAATRNRLRNEGPLFVQANRDTAARLLKEGRKHAAKGLELERAAFRVRNLGFVAGSALVGAGVHQALNHTKYKDSEKKKAAITAGSVGALFAVRSAYIHGLGSPGFSAFRKALKKVIIK